MSNQAYAVINGFTSVNSSAPSSDFFGGSSIDASVWNVLTFGSTATVSEGSGELQISLTGTGPLRGGVQAVWPQNLTGGAVQAQLSDTSAAGSTYGAGMSVALIAGGGNGFDPTQPSLYLTMENSILYAEYTTARGGSSTTLRTAGWSASTMAYLRIREQSGTIYYETSPDASAWTVFTTVPVSTFTANGAAITSLYPSLMGYYYPTSAVTGLSYGFDNFTGPLGVPSPAVQVSAGIVSPSGALVAAPGLGLPTEITAAFTPGHSDQAIYDAVVSAVQSAASDATLNVNILRG